MQESLNDLKEPKDIYDNEVGYQNIFVLKARILTFELLIWLNIYSNRSYNNISQYPVFPWALTNYENPIKNDSNNYNYHDLSLSIGIMELNEESEKKEFLWNHMMFWKKNVGGKERVGYSLVMLNNLINICEKIAYKYII